MKRVFLIILDSFGIGHAPDAADFGDAGSDTFASVYPLCKDDIPNLTALGLTAIDETPGEAPEHFSARIARLTEVSRGKDTTIGHWELAGLVSPEPLPTFPDGFPEALLRAFSEETGRGVLCNRPYSGTEVIRDYGREHEKTGKFIVYTSADSVFQIAAHESVVPPDELYRACECARALLTGKLGVGRVIARPFVGEYPDYVRTKNRHDYSLPAPGDTLPDIVQKAGLDTVSVGKIRDIFASRGFHRHLPAGDNPAVCAALDTLAAEDFSGLVFANLVDFDMLYGHRNDVPGYAKALAAFDRWLGEFLPKLGKDDLLILTADHGCDPLTPSTDHSRERVPCLLYSPGISPKNLHTREGFADVAATVLDALGLDNPFPPAESLLQERQKNSRVNRSVP